MDEALFQLILTRALRIVFIVVVGTIIYFVLRYLIHILTVSIQRLDKKDESEFDFRTKTILRFLHSIGVVAIIVTTLLTILSELEINVAPLIASVGVAGLALGLGAQTLVKDAIAGLFILIEDQFHVGDSIQVGSVSGTVEHLGLRTTHMRDLNGTLHIVPNGDIRTVSNYTNSWARVRLELMIPYEEDLDRLFKLLRQSLAELAAQESIEAQLLEPFTVTGPEELGEWGVRLRILAKAHAGGQWGVQRTLRRHILDLFKAEKIAFAHPRQEVVLIGDDSDQVAHNTQD